MLLIADEEGKDHIKINILGLKIKIKYDNSPIFPYRKRQKEILNYKFVHIVNNGLHSVNIINFINKYFDPAEHCFIFPHVMFETTKETLNGFDNIYYCPLSNINLKYNKKIIVHGMFDHNMISQFYKHKNLLSKTYWFIWGGDLYSAPETDKDDYVRANVAGILTSFDKEVWEEKYNKTANCYDVTYPHDITEDMLISEPHDYVHIQVNNSADETTLEMLDILSKFANENIKVTTILSYKTVGHNNVCMEIMKKGYEIFKEKFNPIIEFMPKEEYAKHLASVDIYISNQDRQQGNGNASIVCSLGHKVYTKSDTSVYKKYNSIGIRYYDTYKIANMNFEEFCHLDPVETERSVKLLKERMKDETKVKQWSDFFNS